MNLVSIFSFKMPLQILYLSAGFKKHLSNQVLSRRRILSGGSAEPCQLQGLLAPARALQRFAVEESWGISVAPPQPSPAEHHCFPTGFLYPSGVSTCSQTYYAQFAARTQPPALSVPPGSLLYPSPGQTHPLVLLQGAAVGYLLNHQGHSNQKEVPAPVCLHCDCPQPRRVFDQG